MILHAHVLILGGDMANATKSLTTAEALAAALRAANQPAQAERLYRVVLASNPESTIEMPTTVPLRDIGLVRYQPAIETCKPFWMAWGIQA
jgi:hypothetical protein